MHPAFVVGTGLTAGRKGSAAPGSAFATRDDLCEPLICKRCPLSGSLLCKMTVNKGCQGHAHYFYDGAIAAGLCKKLVDEEMH